MTMEFTWDEVEVMRNYIEKSAEYAAQRAAHLEKKAERQRAKGKDDMAQRYASAATTHANDTGVLKDILNRLEKSI